MLPDFLAGLASAVLLQAGESPAAPADGAPAPVQGPLGGLGSLIIPMALVFMIFYFLVFRPEGRKRKERQLMIQKIKKGDEVVTTGGIIGEVWRAEGNEIMLTIDKDKGVRARFARSAIFEVLPAPGTDAARTAGEARPEEKPKP